MKKQENGITLIALVVTIIVLLILAGIAISLTIGNNELFVRAQNAANTWRKAEVNEQSEMENFEGLYDNTVKDLGLDGERKEITFTFIDAYGNPCKLIAFEGDTWGRWLTDVLNGVHSAEGAIDDRIIERFASGDVDGWGYMYCKLEGMVSGADIEYTLPSGERKCASFYDKIDSNIVYHLYAA